MTYVCDRAWDPLQKLLFKILIKGHLGAQGAKVIFIFHESILSCPFFTYPMMCNVLKHWSGLNGWLSIYWLYFEIYQIMHILHLHVCVTMTDVFVDVIGFLHGGWSWKLYRGRHVLINVNQLFLLLHRLNNFKVTGGTHLGWGWGWVRQDHSHGHQPGPRS